MAIYFYPSTEEVDSGWRFVAINFECMNDMTLILDMDAESWFRLIEDNGTTL